MNVLESEIYVFLAQRENRRFSPLEVASGLASVNGTEWRTQVSDALQSLRLQYVSPTEKIVQAESNANGELLYFFGLRAGIPQLDVLFMNWLARSDVRILHRSDIPVTMHEPTRANRAHELFLLLAKYVGYMVPYEVMSCVIDHVALDHKSVELKIRSLRRSGYFVDNPLYTAKDFGVGLGISHFPLCPQSYRLLQYLWLHQERYVTRNEITSIVFDKPVSQPIQNAYLIHSAMHRLRQEIVGSPYQIVTNDSGKEQHSYKLVQTISRG